MQSEVRKVLERERETWDETSLWGKIDAAERADAARREEPVQALRQAVAEVVAKWGVRYVPIDAANMVRDILAELNAIIATKPESQPATASGPVHDMTPADSPKECDRLYVTATGQTHDLTPVTVQQVREIVAEKISEAVNSLAFIQKWKEELQAESGPSVTPADEHISAIAAQAVRDAMPDAVEDAIKAVAATLEWDGFPLVANAFRTHAAKLRHERGV